MKLKCKQCGKEFELSDGEVEFYRQKGLSLPKRCKSCRNENRNSSDFWRKKPLWFCVLALILIIAGAFFFGNSGEPSIAPDSGTSLSVQTEPAITATENESTSEQPAVSETESEPEPKSYTFRNESSLEQHFEKHGGEFDYADKEEYLAGANRVISDPNALTKTEKEDGDFVYYLPESNELVILSTDGYIRTYFRPDSGMDYFNKQ